MNKRLLNWLFGAVVILTTFSLGGNKLMAQNSLNVLFSEIELSIDTNQYSYKRDRIFVENEWKLPFEYKANSAIVEVRLFPRVTSENKPFFTLKQSNEYQVIDSLSMRIEGYYYCKLRFSDLADMEFINLNLVNEAGQTVAIPLFPYTETRAVVYPGSGEVFIGEEKNYVVETNFPENIKIDPIWKETDDYEYRIHRQKEEILLSIVPRKTGPLKVEVPIQIYRPNVMGKKPIYQLEKQVLSLTVKGSRLKFLTFDKREVIWEIRNPMGEELQIDNHRSLELNKTYRLEESDEKGGPLVAELFTVRRLSNDKILCMLRPYNYHKQSEGYLYIKDGDEPKFITNINILPEPKIDEVSILRKGGDWVHSKQVFPGETVSIRLQGDGLNRTDIKFEDLNDISGDSLIKNESVSHYLLRVPVDIRKKSINIYSGNKKTGVSLDIVEYQQPKPLDFVTIGFGGKSYVVTDVKEPILVEHKIGDVSIDFDNLFIDDDFQLYGKQYIEIEVRVMDEDNKLIEKQLIDDIVVCPGITSPRSFSYGNSSDCMKESISLNDFLSNKTYDLKNWYRLELIIKHRKGQYDGQGYTSRVEIVKARYLTFDVDLSVPAGLIIKKAGEPGFPGLSGISLAMLAQFSFYKKGEIQKLYPFKVGAGFLAKNAFNFNPEAERDLGIVILGSVYPTTKNRKISFPLFFGAGFYMYESKFFFLIGPGVSINF